MTTTDARDDGFAWLCGIALVPVCFAALGALVYLAHVLLWTL